MLDKQMGEISHACRSCSFFGALWVEQSSVDYLKMEIPVMGLCRYHRYCLALLVFFSSSQAPTATLACVDFEVRACSMYLAFALFLLRSHSNFALALRYCSTFLRVSGGGAAGGSRGGR